MLHDTIKSPDNLFKFGEKHDFNGRFAWNTNISFVSNMERITLEFFLFEKLLHDSILALTN